MKVAVDARHLGRGRGVARYSEGLVRALREHAPQDEWRLVAPSRAARLALPRLDRLAGGADVALVPAPAPVRPGVPYVLTVHDLTWLEAPGDFPRWERAVLAAARVGRLVERAAAVAAVSEATRRAVLARWPGARVEVVAPGIDVPRADPARAAAVRERLGVAGPVVLFAGVLEPRKAPDVLVRAWARAGLDATLVLAGGGGMAVEGPRVVRAGHLERADLEALLCDATALVLPSWREGFGLPPLEALAAGVPPVVADLPVYDETVGDGALRFAPGDEAGLAEQLARVIGDPAVRAEVVARGRPRALGFTWERSAAAVHALLTEAAAR